MLDFKLKCNLTCAWSNFQFSWSCEEQINILAVVMIFTEEVITFMAEVIMLIPMTMNLLDFLQFKCFHRLC